MISIITPVYNGEEFIEACLKNVIEQKCPNIEHIIVDGGSTDKTVEIIKQYSEKYSHILWISEKDRGQSDAMNKGIEMAKGSIIGILNADDFYEPNVLNRVLEIFKDLSAPSLVVANCNMWDYKNRLKHINKPSKLCLVDMLVEQRINQDNQIDTPFPVNPSAYFYHKSLHDKVGLYSLEEDYVMDLDFLLRAVQVAKVKYVDEIWGNFRFIPGTKTFDDREKGENIKRKERIRKKHFNRLSLKKKSQVTLARFISFFKVRIFYFTRYPERFPQAIKTRLNKTFNFGS
ncbi:MAG: glycosyltransferase family 2 protein [Xenococcaceae cyanobacterium MO_188.B19]|nr:glycosyltransferase family 2 protein [Xenococcaceae cyanobacterium MO_188.B19]